MQILRTHPEKSFAEQLLMVEEVMNTRFNRSINCAPNEMLKGKNSKRIQRKNTEQTFNGESLSSMAVRTANLIANQSVIANGKLWRLGQEVLLNRNVMTGQTNLFKKEARRTFAYAYFIIEKIFAAQKPVMFLLRQKETKDLFPRLVYAKEITTPARSGYHPVEKLLDKVKGSSTLRRVKLLDVAEPQVIDSEHLF